ncbi:MAG TPA: DUF5668 domain-containing protein [Anseongella sp.]
MKARDLFWGVFFILFGALLLLDKFDVIELWWRMRDVWRLWPIILILIGMNLIAKRTEIIYNIGIVLLLLAFGYLVVYGYQLQHNY